MPETSLPTWQNSSRVPWQGQRPVYSEGLSGVNREMSEAVQLRISPAWIEDYCQCIKRSTITVEKRLVALDTLRTFISAASGPELLHNETCVQVKTILGQHIEKARDELMAESAFSIAAALEQHDVGQIVKLFTSLSRSGFWQALIQSTDRMEDTRLEEITAWALQWLKEKKRQGEQASSYPDAIDFASAGIDVSEFTAMTDLCKYLSSR